MEEIKENKFKTFYQKYKDFFSYGIIIIVVLLIKQFIVTPIKVNGDSMYPTLHDKDIMILDKFSYYFNDIKRFDIVVVKEKNEYLIKRVIGLPGESVKYENNKLYINNKEIKESFQHEEIVDYTLKNVIPEGYYFVVGDNRPVSLDSRVLGLMKQEDILGKTSLVLFPFNRFGAKN